MKKVKTWTDFIERFEDLSAQSALLLARHCGALSKATYFARLLGGGSWVAEVDNAVSRVIEYAVGCPLSVRAEMLTEIEIKKGGLGVRKLSYIIEAAHITSFYLSCRRATALLAPAGIPSSNSSLNLA